jgi:hypothetical protein
MKKFLFPIVVCICCALGASAQNIGSSSANSEAQMFRLPEHPYHASQAGMGPTQDVMERSPSISVHGERPMWEVIQAAQEAPLGDTARLIRAEHANAKKATRVWSN